MTASWAGICCSDPPALAVSLRKATHTYHSLVNRRAFTVNIPSAAQARQVDYLGIASGRDLDKLSQAGLTTIRANKVDAPVIQEFPLVIECRLIHQHEIGLHTLFVGAILDVAADPAILGPQGGLTLDLLSPLLFSAAERAYYTCGPRLGDAFRIGRDLTRLDP
jgi:flavin reductase (DIM6/NTAB) family NADH-FMN oxidoreductase RutF